MIVSNSLAKVGQCQATLRSKHQRPITSIVIGRLCFQIAPCISPHHLARIPHGQLKPLCNNPQKILRNQSTTRSQRLPNPRKSSVLIVGIGGVGSWAAEAAARSGLGKITIVDLDHVAESNINRQIQALDSTVGMAKTEAMKLTDCRYQCAVRGYVHRRIPERRERFEHSANAL
jgi:hypothetical protein